MSRELGREERRLVLLGEGNTSADIGDGTFWVKASGSCMATLAEEDLCRVSREEVLHLLDEPGLDNAAISKRLHGALIAPSRRQPSVETFLHALCLSLGGARWVGHTHTDSVLQILCSEAGAEPFRRHLLAEAIVVCGRHVAVIPFADPGQPLALAVRDELNRFIAAHGSGPRMLLMEGHGAVALGRTSKDVVNILLMLDKWARVLLGTYRMGGPRFIAEALADHLNSRPDEVCRRRQLSEA